MKVRAFLLVICLAVLTACSQTTPSQPDPVGAYQVMVDWLYRTDDGLNAGRIFAIDTTQTGLPDPDRLFDALKNDPRYAQHELMNTTRAKLVKQGLISDDMGGFKDGFLIEFSSASITPDTVTAQASKWVSGLGAIFATLTVRWQDDAWVLGDVENFGIA